MMEKYLFEVPGNFAAAYQTNQLSRFGGLLKDNATGRIVGHLQESAVSNTVMNGFLAGPLAPINAVSSLAANAQLAGIRSLLEAMRIFQFATLGVSAAGLGVSAVGFTILNKKINSISTAIQTLDETVDSGFRSIFKARIRDVISELKGLIAVAAHKFALEETGAEWDTLGKKFIEKSERFRSELQFILADSSLDEEAFEPMLSALLLSNSSACKSFLLADNIKAAGYHAEAASKTYDNLFDEVTPMVLYEKCKNTPNASNIGGHKPITLKYAQQKIRFIRDIQESAASLPYLMETLKYRKISGVDYVAAVQHDSRQPLLVLSASRDFEE